MGNTGNVQSGGGGCTGMHFHIETGADAADMRAYKGGEAFPFDEPAYLERVCSVWSHLEYYESSEPPVPPVPAPGPEDCDIIFPDAAPSDEALGADIGAGAGQYLLCDGVLDGHYESCPTNTDSATLEMLCPPSVLGDPNYPYAGTHVMCGGCNASRAEHLGFGLKALVDPEIYDNQIVGCAENGQDPCGSWMLCTEANNIDPDHDLDASDWQASLIGWAIERGYFTGDGGLDNNQPRPCRPDDAILWIEAATLFARLAGLEPGQLADGVENPQLLAEVHADFEQISEALDMPGTCTIPEVQDGDEWWIPAAVAFHNAGIYCMPKVGELYTANICGEGDVGTCQPTRYVLATVAARLRGIIPLDSCEPIDQAPVCVI
jgi:hypothetical protein